MTLEVISGGSLGGGVRGQTGRGSSLGTMLIAGVLMIVKVTGW